MGFIIMVMFWTLFCAFYDTVSCLLPKLIDGWHFYSGTWMTKLVLISTMVTILKRLGVLLPLSFDTLFATHYSQLWLWWEVIFVGPIEMVWCPRQGYYETRALARNITTPSAAISTPCWLCQPLPIHDGSYSTCILFTSVCLFVTSMIFLMFILSNNGHLTVLRNHGFLRNSSI